MADQLVLVVVGWVLGLITSLGTLVVGHWLDMRRMRTELKLQRDNVVIADAHNWTQEESLRRLGSIVLHSKYPRLADVVSVVSGVLRTENNFSQEQVFRITGAGALIGSEPDCDVRLSLAPPGYQARILIANDTFIIEGLRPDAPVCVNGEPRFLPAKLRNHDLIEVAGTRLRFSC